MKNLYTFVTSTWTSDDVNITNLTHIILHMTDPMHDDCDFGAFPFPRTVKRTAILHACDMLKLNEATQEVTKRLE